MSSYEPNGRGKIFVSNGRATMEKRMPMTADGLSCGCAGHDNQIFVLGITMTNNPCPNCKSHQKWFMNYFHVADMLLLVSICVSFGMVYLYRSKVISKTFNGALIDLKFPS